MKKTGLLLILFLLIFLAGCWDQNEIEEVGFVLGIALDPEDEENQEREDDHENRFRVTYQIAVPGLLGQEAGSGGGGTGQAYINMVSTGMTNFKNRRNVNARISRHTGLEHLRIIIINEKLARMGLLEHLLDFYVRDHEMRRRTLVMVSEGDAKSILDQEVPLEDLPAMYIEMINENSSEVNQMRSPTDIGQISERSIGKRSYIIQRVLSQGEDIKLTGAAVFMGTDNRMVGWLGEHDLPGYNWIMGEAKNSVIEVEGKEDEGHFVFELDDIHSNTTYQRDGEQDVFDVEIDVDGYFVENWLDNVDFEDEKSLNELEEKITKKIEEQTQQILDKMQKELYTDIFDFKELVKKEDYSYWEQVREEWDGEGNPFSEATVNVTIDVELRHYMLMEGLERRDQTYIPEKER